MTITVNDPRPRSRTILIDLSDPRRYVITAAQELVTETTDTGEVLSRRPTRVITREVTFDAQGVPSGDPVVLGMLAPIGAAIAALDAADVAAEAAVVRADAARRAAAQLVVDQVAKQAQDQAEMMADIAARTAQA